ncbi:MAG: CDP-glucose 4,6-dehydratase [Rickettsiales bacterium]|nr:CDP-glucose 4,6-dehydratase [Pseudomonadota bacterium]MDA0966758.1 CDP-glucose 4,6-dehydratase [Pseudomonadota bacterium]MDG4543430.1 CDP-glucose 4,6-dehydratase [Rickettsiales bacterium]MDG4546176.1 CDP-glucose 4,6-dehydratase [Rickettsiales bacterium]MDG4547649.1 CDP-glucose 4,6-dehydratase [Rickettsiales bacterium]
MLKSVKSTYKGKKVLVTGHTGFKGTWLVLWLKKLGAEVIGYALEPEDIRGNLYNIADIEGKGLLKSYIKDIRDIDSVNEVIKQNKPEIVFHLAAQPIVRKSYFDPIETFGTNVMGTANLLEAIRNIDSVKSVVVITSDKCYENMEQRRPYKEDDKLGGHDPYSSSKACAELVVSSYRKSFFSDKTLLASARAGNVVGGGDFAQDRLIPDIIESISKGESVNIRSPNAVRPWQHVLDVLWGYLILGSKLYNDDKSSDSAFNLSPVDENYVNVEQLTAKIIGSYGAGNYNIENQGDKLHEMQMLYLDSQKAIKELGWKPLLNIDDVIEFTCSWYKQHITNSTDIYDFTIEQINQYESIIKNTN